MSYTLTDYGLNSGHFVFRHDSSVYLDVNSPTDNKLSFATAPSSCVDVGSENRLQYERSNVRLGGG